MDRKKVLAAAAALLLLVIVFIAEGSKGGIKEYEDLNSAAVTSSALPEASAVPAQEESLQTPEAEEEPAKEASREDVPDNEENVPDTPQASSDRPMAESNEQPQNTDTPTVPEQTEKPRQSDEPPLPSAAIEAESDDEREMICTISVRCDTILQNMDKLNPDKAGIIPSDGVILSEREAVFYEGESVFNLLQRELKKNKIHMEYVNTPGYGSAYIEGIANIYEFDCGELSGWTYKVNGEVINYGSSKYIIKENDIIEWVYSCDLGQDIT